MILLPTMERHKAVASFSTRRHPPNCLGTTGCFACFVASLTQWVPLVVVKQHLLAAFALRVCLLNSIINALDGLIDIADLQFQLSKLPAVLLRLSPLGNQSIHFLEQLVSLSPKITVEKPQIGRAHV